MIYVWDKFAHIHLCFASVCIFGDSPDADVSHQSTKLFFSLCKELWTSRYLIQRDDQPRADDPESVLLSPKPIRTTLEMQLDPRVSRGSVLVFLRKPIATCDFPVGGGGGGADLLCHSGSAHASFEKESPGKLFTLSGLQIAPTRHA